MEMMKQKPNEESKFWHYSKVIGGGMLVGGLAVAAAPVALSAAGFTAGGTAATTSGTLAGTLAARLMSMAAMASGGGAAAASTGGWFAAAQSAGAAGLSATTNFLIGSTAGTLGGFFASRFGKKNTSEQGQLPDKSQGLPTRTRNDMNDNQTSRNLSFAESRKTADLLADIYQSNNIPTSQKESCSSLDSTDQNQDEEYLSADIQNISLNADEAEQLHCQNQQLQEEENQCKICLDSEMDTLFEPCGHLCTCRSCANMLRVCPICRNHIKKLHRVYRS
ncbi:E3 ubiquitin-protein ligase cblA-like [Crassostrea angulata]|uniref:E3 ubiquitin-protein ligase cblA-like n=1 Tax=Magallana angulata TaxID=2784310 RepID=UPI0022B0BA6B|nr:E3 ubiquitin-protein ligase cblA-like [Crassostrea angulata]